MAQIPDDAWRDKPILVRSDSAGVSHALISYLAARGWGYSVGWPVTETVRTAIVTLLYRSWSPAIETDGNIRDGADVAELTGLLDLSGWPPCMRIFVRRERPHPGAQLDVFEHRDGYRYQTFATNTAHGGGPIAFLEARHRAHARVEDRIHCAKDSGLGRLPSRELDINKAWLELTLLAADLTAWLQTTVLTMNPNWHVPSRKPCAIGSFTPRPGSPEADGLPRPRRHLALDHRDPQRVHQTAPLARKSAARLVSVACQRATDTRAFLKENL